MPVRSSTFFDIYGTLPGKFPVGILDIDYKPAGLHDATIARLQMICDNMWSRCLMASFERGRFETRADAEHAIQVCIHF